MNRVSIELYKHEWKFGRTRNDVETRSAGECFHSYLDRNTEYMFSISFRKYRDEKKKKYLLTLIIKMQILFARAITASTARANTVSPSRYTNTIFN